VQTSSEAHLVLEGPGGFRTVRALPEGVTTFGRQATADVVLDGEGVSREHARLIYLGGRATLQDLGSRNGTFVGDEPVESRVLDDGDTFAIGPHRLRFVTSAPLPAPSPAPAPTEETSAPPHPVVAQLVMATELVGLEHVATVELAPRLGRHLNRLEALATGLGADLEVAPSGDALLLLGPSEAMAALELAAQLVAEVERAATGLGPGARLRAGLHRGPTLRTHLGAHPVTLGEGPEVARALARLAPAGGVLLSDATRPPPAARGWVRPLGPRTVAGREVSLLALAEPRPARP
jgi:class 3 adenylate cyclase